MGRLTKDQDAYGRAMYDFHRTGTGNEIIERDDGFIEYGGETNVYFAEYGKWPAYAREAIKLAKGRVLDGTGWRLARTIESDAHAYVALLEKC